MVVVDGSWNLPHIFSGTVRVHTPPPL